jgi:hypothetical protein
MKRALSYALLVLIAYSGAAQKPVKDKDGIKVYTVDRDGYSIKGYKVELIMEAEAARIRDFMMDFDNYTKWAYNHEASKTLVPLKNGAAVSYRKIGVPWPLDDREMICQVTLKNGANGSFSVRITPSAHPYPSTKGLVRMTRFDEVYFITPLGGGKCKVLVEGVADPGGSVPGWLVDMFITEGPYESMKAMREALRQ